MSTEIKTSNTTTLLARVKELENKIEDIKDVLAARTGIADAQEFGLHYGQAIDYLNQIEEIVNR